MTSPDYMEKALDQAVFEEIDDGVVAGHIPQCVGVVSFGSTIEECRVSLRSVLEDWILVGVKLGHPLPIIDGLDMS